MSKNVDLSNFDIKTWFKEIESREGLIGVPFESDIEIIKSLVIEYNLKKAYSKQCYTISKLVMDELIQLLKTDGHNTKKEALGILLTYTED